MKAEDQSAERDLFEKWAREEFVCHEYSFAIAQPYGYINTIQSKTFAGRVNAQYADIQMLWLTWRGARAALSAREAPARVEYTLDGEQAIAVLRAAMTSASIEPNYRADLIGFFCSEWNKALAASPQAPTTEGSET